MAGNGDQFIVDGTTYKYNMTVSGSERLKAEAVSNDVVAYLDANGYVAYIDESAITYDYAYVLSMGNDDDRYGTDGTKGSTYYARLILTDGTMVKVETDATSKEAPGLKNQLVSYSVDKNDVYTLTKRSENPAVQTATASTDVNIENGKAGFKIIDDANKDDGIATLGNFSANSNTVFIVVDSDDDSFDDYDVSIYTGIKNVPDIEAIAGKTVTTVALDNKGAVARVVYIEDGDVSGTDEVTFAIANSNAKIQKDSENGEYYEIDAVVDGAKDTLEVKAGSTSAVDALVKDIDNDAASISSTKSVVALKSMTENSDGFISSAKVYEAMDADGDGLLYVDENDNDKYDDGEDLYVTGTKKAEDGTVGLGGTYYAYSDDVVVARWTLEDDAIEISRINSVKNDTNDKVVAIMDGRVVIGLFIIEVKGGEEAASNDATISNVEMFGVPVENGKVTVPGSANGAGEQRLTFDLADGAKVTGVYYRESTSGKWNSWGDDYKLTANLGQSKLYVKIESVAADGTSTDSYEFEATLESSYTMTITNSATNAVRVNVGDANAVTITNSKSITEKVGADGTTLTIRVSGGSDIQVTASNAQVWDNGDGTYEISDVTADCTITIADK